MKHTSPCIIETDTSKYFWQYCVAKTKRINPFVSMLLELLQSSDFISKGMAFQKYKTSLGALHTLASSACETWKEVCSLKKACSRTFCGYGWLGIL